MAVPVNAPDVVALRMDCHGVVADVVVLRLVCRRVVAFPVTTLVFFGTRCRGVVALPVNVNDVIARELHLVAGIEAGNAKRLVNEPAHDLASLHFDDLPPHAFAPEAPLLGVPHLEHELHEHSRLDGLLRFLVGSLEGLWVLTVAFDPGFQVPAMDDATGSRPGDAFPEALE